MPYASPKPCTYPGCGALSKGGRCDVHKPEKLRKSAHQRGYTYKWSKAAKQYLKEHPLCRRCGEQGVTKAAEVVDHVIPHKGDMGLFWDRSNWQALCSTCHNIKTAKEDGRYGYG